MYPILIFFPIFLSVAKSPAFTHFAATLNGLSTVRAYKAENLLKNEYDYHQDTHSACWFMFISAGSAFGFSLNLICWLFIGCMLAFYMFLDKGASGESVGLALSQVLSLTGVLQFGKIWQYVKQIRNSHTNVK